MRLTWRKVDELREAKGLRKSELARLAGIPETTIYRGLKSNATLQPSMAKVIGDVLLNSGEADNA